MKANYRRFLEARLPIIGIAAGLFGISLLSFASFFTIDEFQHDADWVGHSHEVRFELEQTMFMVRDAQAATRGFAIAGKPEFLAPYEEVRRDLPAKFSGLAALVADDPTQVRNVSLLKAEAEYIMGLLEHTVSLRRDSDSSGPTPVYVANGSGKAALDRVRALVSEMQEREAKLLAGREHETDVSAGDVKLLIMYGTIATYLVLCGAFWMLANEVRQRKRADKALVEANNELLHHAGQLEVANKELESFSYSISHDLRIPLRAIAGYASMLAEDYGEKIDSEGQRLLNVVRENSKRMGALIDDLLTFSKLGRKALSSTAIEMRALVENVVAEMKDGDQSRNATVVLEELPPACGDRALLKQVWVNLVSNAVKYSGKTEAAEIRISGARHGDETIYAVRDNGVGFDMQYYNKLFGVFQRLHSVDEFPGTGVGLAIVQRIVLRHGGRVWAEGAVNQGATFFFALPHRG
jgi:signal transduction histidine kinase